MTVDGVKVTWIHPHEELEHRERSGFRSVCAYGTISPERNEVGCIARVKRGAVHRPTRVPGIFCLGH